jgi:hypothetical protein
MTLVSTHSAQGRKSGIQIANASEQDCQAFMRHHGVEQGLRIEPLRGLTTCSMQPFWVEAHAPQCNTLMLYALADNLTQEILWSLLISPCVFTFNSLEALASAVRVRENIVQAARKTALAFQTEAAERPAEYWHYVEDAGFILQPQTCLIKALISATQPEATGKRYDFSCYRASEYVILLGLAQEAEKHHPALLSSLQRLNQVHAVRSGQFHEVFLHEYGSLESPLPAQFFVPGDRIWFRNPHEASSDVTGYEGSWVIYIGGGLFSNFWNRDQPYSLSAKCIEIYHWRDGLQTHANGEVWIDETIVEACVAQTLQDPEKIQKILSVMMRMRDDKGIYAEGGCLDASRECPKQIHFTDCELQLPSFSS